MTRHADYPIDALFLNRWSPRAMSGVPLSEEALHTLFEAARFAPSCANSQPWRFIYGRAQTEAFSSLFGLLVEGNRVWCAKAGALVLAASKTTLNDGSPSRTHSFDTGAAWMSIALQGNLLGLVVHGMAGFDYERARTELGIPEGYRVEAMVALGYPGKVEELPERLRARETPSDRNAASSFLFEGRFRE